MNSYQKGDILEVEKINGSAPMYNFKSTIVSCTGTDYVFLYGGFDELDNLDSNVYLLNTKTRTWEVDDKHPGLYREGHSAVYIGQGNILVFGGIPHDEFPTETSVHSITGNGTRFEKDSLMMVYNIFSRTWVGPPPFALINAPSSRSRHACCLSPDGTKVYISGGLIDSAPLDDLYCYDLVAGSWTGPIVFVSRFNHFISEYEGKVYSFGGLNKDMNHVNHTLTWFDLKDHSVGELVILRQPMVKADSVTDDYEDNFERRALETFFSADYEQIYLDTFRNPAVKLDISVPRSPYSNKEFSISAYDVVDSRFTPLFNSKSLTGFNEEIFLNTWKHSIVSDQEGKLFLIGHPASQMPREESAEESLVDTKLSVMISISLADLGIPNTTLIGDNSNRKNVIGNSLSNDFKNLLLNNEFTDFQILTLTNDTVKEEYNDNPETFENEIELILKDNSYSYSREKFSVIRVHKAILLARWEHFQRVISSGMNETIKDLMFIPEPYMWVQGMIYYLYTNTIEFEPMGLPGYSIIDYSGLLILSHVYSLPELRTKVLQQLYHMANILGTSNANNISETMIELILRVWENVEIAEEPVFLLKITSLIRDRWSTIIRSKIFKELPKESIIRLCQECTAVENNIYESKDSLSEFSRTGSNTPEPDIFRAMNISPLPETPNGRTLRSSHVNSPFLRLVPNTTTHSELRTITNGFPLLSQAYDETATP
ncbi:hypothetical protein CAAN1_01S00650 [[Candida] anglica]|uniref:BTB domain-containing protein n=1 Tax=[Candida] anglica TaxID=148631 RepID=A0ABP0EJ15_9ASCO